MVLAVKSDDFIKSLLSDCAAVYHRLDSGVVQKRVGFYMMLRVIKPKKIYYILYLISFYFFSYGKFFTISMTILRFFYDFLKVDIDRSLYASYKYFFVIFFVFLLAFISGVMQGNDLLHIIRNNFFSLVFIVTGIQVVHSYKKNILIFFDDTIRVVGWLALLQIGIYVASMISPQFHVYLDQVLLKKVGYSISFAGLGHDVDGYGMKMVTMLTSIYIFLIPFGFIMRARKLGMYSTIMVVAVILSGSITQYGILFLYVMGYVYVSVALQGKSLRSFFKLKVVTLLSLMLYFVIQSGVGMVLFEKGARVLNPGSYGNELTSFNVRVIQAEILFDEFLDEPIYGQGLGYDSEKYRVIRDKKNRSREIGAFNYSMYENQYLDILMKFGLLGAVLIYCLFLFFPVFILIKKYKHGGSEMYVSALLGYFGLALYAGSNGNTFYMYTTMFVWGVVIYLISSNTLKVARQ